MASELGRVIEQVEKDKGIDKSIIIEALESALLTAAKKKYGLDRDIEAHFNADLGEIELFQFKTVVDAVADNDAEIRLEEAVKLDPDVSVGDSIGVKLDSNEFGRIAAQTAKQVIIQKVRDAERDIIFNEFQVRKGEVVSGNCRRVEKGCIVVDLGRTDAILPTREQIPGESFRPGDRVLGFLIDVQQTQKGPKIVLSRTCPELLMELFKQEVPEVSEGIVQIKSAAREPGIRAKIGVTTSDSDVDPVGACVGIKGSRVQNIVQELRGEKIDIVLWDADDTRFVCNALAPAEVIKVLIDEEERSMVIVVADNQLSLAIGKKGQNVKLASQLTGWKLDILSETRMTKRVENAKKLLMGIEGMNDTLAQGLYQYGYTVEQIAQSEPAQLLAVPGVSEEKGKELKQNAKQYIESGKFKELEQSLIEKEIQKGPGSSQGSKASSEDVLARLKAEIKAHEAKKKSEDEKQNETAEAEKVSELSAEKVSDAAKKPTESSTETETVEKVDSTEEKNS